MYLIYIYKYIINGKMKNVYLEYRFLPKFYRFVLLRSYTRHVEKKLTCIL